MMIIRNCVFYVGMDHFKEHSQVYKIYDQLYIVGINLVNWFYTDFSGQDIPTSLHA